MTLGERKIFQQIFWQKKVRVFVFLAQRWISKNVCRKIVHFTNFAIFVFTQNYELVCSDAHLLDDECECMNDTIIPLGQHRANVNAIGLCKCTSLPSIFIADDKTRTSVCGDKICAINLLRIFCLFVYWWFWKNKIFLTKTVLETIRSNDLHIIPPIHAIISQ